MKSKQLGILTAVVYSDLFSSPLTLPEVQRYHAGNDVLTEHESQKILTSLYPLIKEKNGYYYLSGRERIITMRQKSDFQVRQKRTLAETAAKRLALIPTVQFIGISGSVAAGSAAMQDDVDIFVITRTRTLFISRLLILLLLELSGLRRRRRQKDEKDAICVNMVIDDSSLRFPAERQDLYTAREIAQLVPLFSRENTYRKFFRENKWVRTLLPNAAAKFCPQEKKRLSSAEKTVVTLLKRFETCVKVWQLRRINAHKTSETITEHFLAFHPRDHRERTLRRLARRMNRYRFGVQTKSRSREIYIDKEKDFFYTA
jgi:hypothetical protein